jgi:protein SCO1/2
MRLKRRSGNLDDSVIRIALLLIVLAIVSACNRRSKVQTEERVLPYYGEHDIQLTHSGAAGESSVDTIYYTIPKFSFVNQNGRIVSNRDYAGKIFVADFFFTHCESICPMITAKMVNLQHRLDSAGLLGQVMLLSHTVDPERDTPDTLKQYAALVGADTATWNFVTGNADDIYWQAQQGYIVTAFPDAQAQGGFFHTDKVVLVDPEMHIRGYYDGTSTQSMKTLFEDIQTLKMQYHP